MPANSLKENEHVLRAARSRAWIGEAGRYAAFILREGEVETGLSLNIQALTPDLDGWLRTTFRKSFGALLLTTREIQALTLNGEPINLSVIQTGSEIKEASAHASLMGLPHPVDDRDRAERIASLIAQIATVIDDTTRGKAALD